MEQVGNLWACTGCGHCTEYCLHKNQPGMVLLAGRDKALSEGLTHPALQDYPDRFRNRCQRLAEKYADQHDSHYFASEGDIALWPGCDTIDKQPHNVARLLEQPKNHSLHTHQESAKGNDTKPMAGPNGSTTQQGNDRLKKTTHPLPVLVESSQVCAGYPLIAAGYRDAFRWHAEKVAKSLERFRQVVVNCSACVHTLKHTYSAENIVLAPEVLSTAEFLSTPRNTVTSIGGKRTPRVTSETIKQKPIIYYHDPCYLARYEQITQPPREILSQYAQVKEFAWSEKDTQCCGGGGLLPKTMPDVADSMARNRLAEISHIGGGVVVTSCGTCSFLLQRNAPSGVQVFDLPQAIEWLSSATANE